MLYKVHCYLAAEVSGQPIAPIFKYHAVKAILDCLTLADGTGRLFRNVSNELPIYAA